MCGTAMRGAVTLPGSKAFPYGEDRLVRLWLWD